MIRVAALMGVTVFACVLAQAGEEPSTAPTTAPTTAASAAPAGIVVPAGVVRAGKDLPWSATQPTQTLPRGLGVNIHFCDPKPGEMEMMAAAGVTIVRMDFTWNSTERVKGEYDFAHYDRLMDALDKDNMRLLAILDYGSPFYDDWNGPRDEATRAAFVAWVKAAVTHFKGRGVLWEMWNEPNLDQFWKPKANANDYIQLALAVGKAMREVAPAEAYIGPATAGVDFAFLEACFQAGLLEYWDAVSVHPYRRRAPESVVEDYVKLGAMIVRHKPEGKYVPIISGEWGYSSGWPDLTEEQQAKYLARQWLVNLACDVPVSIWYDWHDDGPDPKEPEHHFGTVQHEHRQDQTPLYEPKPAYTAMKTLTEQLAGYTFDKRLWTGDENEWVLFFRRKGEDEYGKDDTFKLVFWRSAAAAEPRLLDWKVAAVRTHLGEAADSPKGWTFTDAPQYAVPANDDDRAALQASFQRVPWVVYTKGSGLYKLAGGGSVPFTRARHDDNITMTAARGTDVFTSVLTDIPTVTQRVRFVTLDPITAKALPAVNDREVKLLVQNPSGEPFVGRIRLVYRRPYAQPVELVAGQTQTTVTFSLVNDLAPEYGLSFWFEDSNGNAGFSESNIYAPIRVGFADADALSAAWQTHTEGDKTVERTFAIAPADAPEGLGKGVRTIKISYDYGAGWTFGKVMPRTDELKKLPAGAERLEMWVFGDGSGNRLRVRFRDSQGQTFQSELGVLDFTGWRFLSARLDQPDAGHWGGPADGVIRGPIELDTLILIDKTDRTKPSQGEIHVALPQAVSR